MLALTLASASEIRATLLRRAGLDIVTAPARIDEEAIRAAMEVEGASPRDVADTLAEMKARKVAERRGGLVLGCDQVLEIEGGILGKPADIDAARAQLRRLSGKPHRLLSAAVLYEGQRPVWRHVGTVRLTMRTLSDGFIEAYLARNWPGVGDSVGAYKLEEEGVRLFTRVEGDYFTVLGLPLLDILGYLIDRGLLET